MASRMESTGQIFCVEPDPVTQRLIRLILTPLGEVEILMVASLDSPQGQQLLEQLERLKLNAPGLNGGGQNWLLINGNVLANGERTDLERLKRIHQHLSVIILMEPGMDARPLPADFPVCSLLRKPLKPQAVLASLGERGMPGDPEGDKLRGDGTGPQDGVLAGLDSLISEMEMAPEMIADLTRSFADRGVEYLLALRQAVESQDLQKVGQIAHTLKGMSGNLRFGGLTKLSDQLSVAVKTTAVEQLDDIIKSLESGFEEIVLALKERWPDRNLGHPNP